MDILKLILVIPIFPLYLITSVLNPFKFLKAKIGEKFKMLLELAVATLILLPLWIALYSSLGISIAQYLRLLEEPIGISGTGSMYPTFDKGTSKDPKEQSQELVATPGMLPYPNGVRVLNHNFFGTEIKHGDIVVFENAKVNKLTEKVTGRSTGLVKRVIGLPGDTIEIKDGLVYRNGSLLLENYTARARSTFGGDFLNDCTPLKIPDGKLFVMGDNRKGSTDSRHEVGLISFADVDHVLPYDKQPALFGGVWRDAKNDLSQSSKIKLDKNSYLKLLNTERSKLKLKPLKYQPKLENSAKLRGQVILRDNDFTSEATRSGYTMREAMADSGYSNITFGETLAPGYFEDQELFEALFEFPSQKQFLLEKDFDEIGIAEVEIKVNGCNQQVIVQHLAGFIPPNYSPEYIQSFKEAIEKIKAVQGNWKELENSNQFYQDKKQEIDRINQIIALRISRIAAIIQRIESNQWLTQQQNNWIKEDVTLGNEQNEIATKLNNNN